MTDLLSDIKVKIGPSLTGITISTGKLPPEPVEHVALYEYAGREPFHTMDGEVLQRPGLQVVARSASYATARARLQTIEDLLDGLVNTTLSGTAYVSIFATQSVVPLGWENNAIRLAQNYMVERAR